MTDIDLRIASGLHVATHITVGSRWRHRKGGRYTVIAVARNETDLTPVIVYRSADGLAWVRSLAEFEDGRFTPFVDDPPEFDGLPEELRRTARFMREAHGDQKTKGGEPYWTHPLAVMRLLPDEATIDERHAALLHDVIEDCGVTAADLAAAGFSDRTISLVEDLSRPKGEGRPTYKDWILGIAATRDRGLICIKLADIRHNSLPERLAKLPKSDQGIIRRYEQAERLLTAALEEVDA